MADNRLDIKPIGGTSLSNPIRFSHNGFTGSTEIKGFEIKSNSNQHVYTNIQVEIKMIAKEPIVGADFFTNNGWSIKLVERESSIPPTEEEWDEIFPLSSINIEAIGGLNEEDEIVLPDTNTKRFFFMRVFCPGHTEPGQYNHEISINYNSINVSQP